MKHRDQALALLAKQIANPVEVTDIDVTAHQVAGAWVDPLSGGHEAINGLIYGLVQSGKTGVMTVTGAIGADQGYRAIMILTSDIDPLYEQTLDRVREAFPGVDIISKRDFRDATSFIDRIKGGTCAIVTTKNASLLRTLIQNFRAGRVRGLSCLIMDDEADQASLNTRASRADGSRSAINDQITELRSFFDKNTYLQVTATPQALFLQPPGHEFRPRFTVLSHPGADYVGGDDFFGEGSPLVAEFDIADITALAPGPQPRPNTELPRSLGRALDTFMVGATFKRHSDAEQNCAFLCHVSTRTADHQHIVDLLRKYKSDLASGIRAGTPAVLRRLRAAYDDLGSTHPALLKTAFDTLVEAIGFFSPGISVKLVNGQTDEDVAVKSPYNLFVGGNKLGRGVTIKNLLVSYYGRNPRRPQADTVLQHARMYGYRRRDIGLLRLYLPRDLHIVFRAINSMERSLRQLIEAQPGEEFRGIYLERGLSATRSNIIAPGAVGVYTAGGTYNPAQMLRNGTAAAATARIDRIVAGQQNRTFLELPLGRLQAIVQLTTPDLSASERIWDPDAVAGSLAQFAEVHRSATGYLYLDRDRGLEAVRRETQGILVGDEGSHVPRDKVTLFILRTKENGNRHAAWWPQVRFPSGRYAFAFAI